MRQQTEMSPMTLLKILLNDKVSAFAKHMGTMWHHVFGYVVQMNSYFDIQPPTVINLYERACVATDL